MATDILFIYTIFCSLLVFPLYSISFSIMKKTKELKKKFPYECGFNPMNTLRSNTTVDFYIVAILFTISDIEIVLLLPLLAILVPFNIFIFLFVYLLLFLLLFGFFIEWKTIASSRQKD